MPGIICRAAKRWNRTEAMPTHSNLRIGLSSRFLQYLPKRNCAKRIKYEAYMLSAPVKFGMWPSQFGTLPYIRVVRCDTVTAIPTAICESCITVTAKAHFGGFLQTAAKK